MSEIDEIKRTKIDKDQGYGPLSKRGYGKVLPMTVHGYEIRYRKPEYSDYIELGVWDGNKGAATMRISPVMYQGIKAYQVGWVGLNPKYQGQQLGYELYKGLITLMGINLTSTGSHSEGARKLWLRLSQDPKISAYGFDLGRDIVSKVKPDRSGTELRSTKKGVQVYSDDDGPESVGLILVKRGSTDDAKLDSMLRSKRKKKLDVFGTTRYSPISD